MKMSAEAAEPHVILGGSVVFRVMCLMYSHNTRGELDLDWSTAAGSFDGELGKCERRIARERHAGSAGTIRHRFGDRVYARMLSNFHAHACPIDYFRRLFAGPD